MRFQFLFSFFCNRKIDFAKSLICLVSLVSTSCLNSDFLQSPQSLQLAPPVSGVTTETVETPITEHTVSHFLSLRHLHMY